MSILKANRIENLTTTDGGINVNNSGNVKIGTGSDRYDELTASTANLQVDGGIVFEPGSGNDAEIINYRGTPMVFGTSGSERLRIDGSGRLLIGITSNYASSNADDLVIGSSSSSTERGITLGSTVASAIRFADAGNASAGMIQYVHNSGGTDYFNFYTAATERMRIDGSGRMLIGTTSSRSVSSLSGSLQVEGTGGDSSTISVTRNVASAAPPRVCLAKSRGTSVGSSIVVQSGDSLGEISFSGADGTDADSVAATILCKVDGTPGSNDMPGRLMFSTTADGASSPTERMRIDSSGNMGLGTTSPNSQSGYTSLTLNHATSGSIIDLRRNDTALSGGRLVGATNEFGLESRSQAAGSQISFYVNNVYTGRWTVDGLCFGNDTAAANALDDYEEGTWTPSYSSGLGGTNGYTTQQGSYTKIGRLVTFSLHIQANAGTNSGSEQVKITGLPFTASGSADEGGAFFNYRGNLDSGIGPFLHISQNTGAVRFYSASGGNWVGSDGNGILNQAFHIQGYYYTA